ncbi:hypothetical protein N072000002_08040 [Clostridium tetani]|uniref:Uncharacterized protein n=1 Tax=Clostridium tetani TaxID=1513 RepID=A0ABC8EBD7_CLOTA|nr:hypothetical protein [Clostridium tetani]BDR75129.1 hypothetical protein K154306013_07890 [Clostridium tetani]BDR80547.1 hypothetical protein K234311028_07930 [Clostridium tetani]BDR89003.1 hypothetical protein N072000002_08040 [Clostridium tetani]
MRENSVFGQRNMTQLKCKIKIVILYGSKQYKDMLNEIKKECNTCTCQYSIIPLYIELNGTIVPEGIIKKAIKARVSEYRKDLDIICLISPNIMEYDKHIVFNSVNKFNTWFQELRNK